MWSSYVRSDHLLTPVLSSWIGRRSSWEKPFSVPLPDLLLRAVARENWTRGNRQAKHVFCHWAKQPNLFCSPVPQVFILAWHVRTVPMPVNHLRAANWFSIWCSCFGVVFDLSSVLQNEAHCSYFASHAWYRIINLVFSVEGNYFHMHVKSLHKSITYETSSDFNSHMTEH